jgi:hypothetical protein
MDRLFPHVLRGLAVVLGLTPLYSTAQTTLEGCTLSGSSWQCSDEGTAYAQAASRAGEYGPDDCNAIFGASNSPTFLRGEASRVSEQTFLATFVCRFQDGFETGSQRDPHTAVFPPGNSCATRPGGYFARIDDSGAVCHKGCRYVFTFGQDIPYTNYYTPDGQTCSGSSSTPVPPLRPTDPDDPQDPDDPPPPDDPDDPEDPDDPDDPDEPDEPEDPDDPDNPGDGNSGDGLDDGQQVVEGLGPKLDAIERAVLGLGPPIQQVRNAIDLARSDANADADRMVSAIDALRESIESQGNGDDDGPPDLTPLTPGDDGGPLPTRDDIVEQGDASALVAQLDTDGFGLTRSCPALSWQQSYDLGWASFDMAQASQLVCWALAILGWMIALGGLIQASFILSQVGAR